MGECQGASAPRVPNFNYTNDGYHIGIANQTPFDDETVVYIDTMSRLRCGTLLGVDDTVAELSNGIDQLGISNKTYFFFTSDHGYNKGNHRLPDNKFNSYMHSLRIPLLVRGPGIPENHNVPLIVTQVDYAPTFLGLAGLETPDNMDGRSLVPALVQQPDLAPASVAAH